MRKIGELEVSEVGLGCNNFGRRVDLEGTRRVVDAALEAGVNFLDTANSYGSPDGESENLLGQVLEGRRDQVVLATKFGWNEGGAPEQVRESIEASLRRLRTDVIDLYQYHKPDGRTPIEETLGAMKELVSEGKVREIGCSNFNAAQVSDDFASLQNEYSLLKRGIESEVLPECERLGVAGLPYFPLASGLLTGKYRRGEDAPEGTRLAGRDQIADNETWDRLDQPIDVAIGWLAAQPTIASVIAGATKPEQVRRNAEAGRWRPSEGDRELLDAIFPPGTDLP